MASLHRLLILTLLGAARAPSHLALPMIVATPAPRTARPRPTNGDDLDGPGRHEADDRLRGLPEPRVLLHGQACQQADVRRRRASRVDGTEATDQDLNVDVPASKLLDLPPRGRRLPTRPRSAAATANDNNPISLDCEMGGIVHALNGVVFYSGAVGNKLPTRRAPARHQRCHGRVDLVRTL